MSRIQNFLYKYRGPLSLSASIGTILVGYQSLKHHHEGGVVQQSSKTNYPERVKLLEKERVQASVESIRKEVRYIKWMVEDLKGQSFIFVCGPSGIGKTCAIYTALQGTQGVITIGPVAPATDQDKILDEVSYRITGLVGSWERNKNAIAIITKMYQEKNQRRLMVIIHASERPSHKDPASLTAAARILADSFGLAVIIDCPESACPSTFTGRERLLNFKQMSYETMRKLPEYQAISDELEKQDNADIVLAVCGGNPLLLDQLTRAIHHAPGLGMSMEDCP